MPNSSRSVISQARSACCVVFLVNLGNLGNFHNSQQLGVKNFLLPIAIRSASSRQSYAEISERLTRAYHQTRSQVFLIANNDCRMRATTFFNAQKPV